MKEISILKQKLYKDSKGAFDLNSSLFEMIGYCIVNKHSDIITKLKDKLKIDDQLFA